MVVVILLLLLLLLLLLSSSWSSSSWSSSSLLFCKVDSNLGGAQEEVMQEGGLQKASGAKDHKKESTVEVRSSFGQLGGGEKVGEEERERERERERDRQTDRQIRTHTNRSGARGG